MSDTPQITLPDVIVTPEDNKPSASLTAGQGGNVNPGYSLVPVDHDPFAGDQVQTNPFAWYNGNLGQNFKNYIENSALNLSRLGPGIYQGLENISQNVAL